MSRFKIDPNGKLIIQIREDVPTQPIEVNIQSNGIAREDQFFFHTEGADFPSEEQLWQRKEEKRNVVHREPLVISTSPCYINDKCTNTLMQSMEPFNKIPRILIEKKSRTRASYFQKTNARITF